MVQHRDAHVLLVKSEADAFSSAMHALNKLVQGPALQNITLDADSARASILDVQHTLAEITTRGSVLTQVVGDLKLPPLNLQILDDVRVMVTGLDALWQAIAQWRSVTSEMLLTPISVLQGVAGEWCCCTH